MKKYVHSLHISSRRALAALIVVLLGAAALLGALAEGDVQALGGPGMEVYFLDLGRVDAILIRCDGETAFIDVGFESDAADAIRFLKALGIDHLDSYIGTHGHYDHIEGAPEMIEAFRPSRIYISHLPCLSAILECANDAQKEIISQTQRVILQPGDSFPIGRGYLTCLGPTEIRQCFTGSSHENENSLILRLDYGFRSLLFTGDTTDRVLREVNARYPGRLRADVLKNPHHNGAHDADVIDMINPKYVVFCTDDKNTSKQSYAQLLAERGIRTLTTGPANQGSVAIRSDGQSLEIRCGYTTQAVTLQSPPPLYAGQDYALSGAIEPNSLALDRQLGWNSSDEGVALVHKGVVRAVAPGTATITAVAINGVSASTEVHVYSAVAVLDQASLRLAVGESKQITGSVIPSGVEGLTGQWITSDPAVATVSGGRVTGVSEGTAQILARLSNGAESVCEITVKGKLAKSVKLDRTKATLKVGDTLTLSARVVPADYDLEDLEWYSSDESVLWVDQYGNVTAVGQGRAKVGAVASEGIYDVCSVKVG